MEKGSETVSWHGVKAAGGQSESYRARRVAMASGWPDPRAPAPRALGETDGEQARILRAASLAAGTRTARSVGRPRWSEAFGSYSSVLFLSSSGCSGTVPSGCCVCLRPYARLVYGKACSPVAMIMATATAKRPTNQVVTAKHACHDHRKGTDNQVLVENHGYP